MRPGLPAWRERSETGGTGESAATARPSRKPRDDVRNSESSADSCGLSCLISSITNNDFNACNDLRCQTQCLTLSHRNRGGHKGHDTVQRLQPQRAVRTVTVCRSRCVLRVEPGAEEGRFLLQADKNSDSRVAASCCTRCCALDILPQRRAPLKSHTCHKSNSTPYAAISRRATAVSLTCVQLKHFESSCHWRNWCGRGRNT